MPDTPIVVDFTRFTYAGYGTIHGADVDNLQVGQLIAVTDTDADTVEATVLEVRGDAANIRVRWNKVLHRT